MPNKPLDVLVQHLVTVALGGGFTSDDFSTKCAPPTRYRELSREELAVGLDFVARGGRVADRLSRIPSRACRMRTASGACPMQRLARRHRMSIGTIVSRRQRAGANTCQAAFIGSVEE